MLRSISLGLIVCSIAGCRGESESPPATMDGGVDIDANSLLDATAPDTSTPVGVCCPIEAPSDPCGGTRAPGGWAVSTTECSDSSVVWGAGRYLVSLADMHGCAVLVHDASALFGVQSCEAGASPPPGPSPVGGGVCCPFVAPTPCEGSGPIGGWASRAASCFSVSSGPDQYVFNAIDVHECPIVLLDHDVCCGCPSMPPDSGIATDATFEHD